MLRKYNLQEIDPRKIDFDPHNPRNESVEVISADPSFEQLKDSVYKHGVLVPIVVRKQVGTLKPYRLVDGERRLRAALATGVPLVPAHIAESADTMDDIVQAFHIHMLRKQWKPVAMTRALKKIMEHFAQDGSEDITSDALEELRIMTGCTDTRLKALRRAAKFSDSILSEVDNGKLSFSHLVQIEESLIEQLSSNYPQLLKKVGKKRARSVLLAKARSKVLTSTRALMDNIVPVIARAKTAEQKSYVEGLLVDFLNQEDVSAEQVLQRYEKKFPITQGGDLEFGEQVLDITEELYVLLSGFSTTPLEGYPKLARKLNTNFIRLRSLLSRKIKAIRAITQ